MPTKLRSLKKHQEELEALVYNLESPPKILCITETWLSSKSDNKDMFVIKGFHPVYFEIRRFRGGGTMIQINENFNFIELITINLDEALGLQIEIYGM